MTTIVWTLREWARAIADLPATPPLPTRTVLIPREAVAHTLRRELIRAGLGAALAGTRFVPELAAAAAVLRSAGVDFDPEEEERRDARLLALFRAGLVLEHFSLELLRTRPGWDEALPRRSQTSKGSAFARRTSRVSENRSHGFGTSPGSGAPSMIPRADRGRPIASTPRRPASWSETRACGRIRAPR